MNLRLFGVFICADTSDVEAFSPAMQLAAMRNIVRQPNGRPSSALHESVKGSAGWVCSWVGVTCTDGVVTQFVCNMSSSGPVFVDLRWLPGTTRYVHAVDLTLYMPWHTQELSRDLRYLYMANCRTIPMIFSVNSKRAKAFRRDPANFIDLRQLPRKMEEMYFKDGLWAGPIHIIDLPPTMRLLHISDVLLYSTLVQMATLPKGLRSVRVHYQFGSKSMALKEIDGQAIDDRVQIATVGGAFERESAYSEGLCRECVKIPKRMRAVQVQR